MSRHSWDIENGDKTIVVGWDRPLQSFFFQIWNIKDERRMSELEELPEKERPVELADLYEKYGAFGGDPIIRDDGCLGGPIKITDIIDLQNRLGLNIPVPEKTQAELLTDKELQR